jgi:hypothetical protein
LWRIGAPVIEPPPNTPLQQRNAPSVIPPSQFIAVRSQLNASALGCHTHRFMEITETSGPRFELLIDRLRAGAAITRNNLTLRLSRDELACDVETLMRPDAASPEWARDHLQRGQAELTALLDEAPLLVEAIGKRPIRYSLVCNYGMGTIAIAEQIGATFRWLADRPPSPSPT